MKKTYEGRIYDVSEFSKNTLRVRSYKPVITPEEKAKQSRYITQRCVQILKIRG